MEVQAGGADVSKSHPRKTLILRNAEARTQDVASNTYIYNSTSGIFSPESTLVNTPTEAHSPLRLPREFGEEAYASGEQRRSEEAEQTGPMVPERLLRSEEAAHQKTRNKLARMARRESSLLQLGISFYSRLQTVGRQISPHDRVWAEYKDLMNDVAQHFSTSPNASDENVDSYNASRFVELGEVEDGDGRERGQNGSGAPTFHTGMIMGDNALTNKVDAVQAKGCGTTSDDDGDHDDEISRHGRPMRPGTASRLSISFFTAQSEDRPGRPPSSYPEGSQEVQEARDSALATPSSSRPYPEAPVELEEELEFSNRSKFTFGSNYTVLPSAPTAEEADFPHATGEVERTEESIPQSEASRPIFSISFDLAGETPRAEASRRRNNRNHGRGIQNSSRNNPRLPKISELAYDPAIFDFSRQSQPEESVRSSSSGVTANGDSGPSEAENETGSQILGASDANVDATAAVIVPSLEAEHDLLMQSTNTVAELREARHGKTRMTDAELEDAPSEDIPRATRATWAPFPWVEVEVRVEITKSPEDLMRELPFDWMVPTPPTVRLSDFQNRTGESSRRRYSSAVQDWVHIANMKAWIDSIAPLEKGFDAVKTLKIQPPRVPREVGDAKSAEERTLDAKLLSENQTEEAECTADGQTQGMKASSGIQTTLAPQMDLPPFEEELSSLINGIQKLSLGPSTETARTAFEEELLSLINGMRNLSLNPSTETAGEVEKESKVRMPRNSNVSGQDHTENLENLINGIRNLSLGPSVDAAGRSIKESKVRLSGDWNVSGRGQYSPKDLDKSPIFGKFLGRNSEVKNPGFTPKKERIATPEVEITKKIDHKCKMAQSAVMPSKERSTRPADAECQEQHQTTSPVPISEEQNEPRATAHLEQSQNRDLTPDQPAVATSPTETTPPDAIAPQPLEPHPRDHQPPPPSREVYVSPYSLQGLSYPDAVTKTKYSDPFSLRRKNR